MPKWIELNDATGAKLKLASIDVQGTPILHIFLTNLAFTNPKWGRAIRELGFNPAPSKKYLVRRVAPDEPVLASKFKGIFPGARIAEMAREAYMLDFSRAPSRTQEERSADVDMRGVKRLGRNEEGLEVFDTLSGRFYRNDKGDRVVEGGSNPPHQFLRVAPAEQALPEGQALRDALTRVATGFVRAMDLGEVQHSEDYDAFKKAVFPSGLPAAADEMLSAAIDGALLRFVMAAYDVAQEAYSPMARLYDYLPPYRGRARGEGAVPPPLNIAAQRLLGDTTGKTILFPNAFDGAAFAFLPEGTDIRAYKGQAGVLDLSGYAAQRPGVTWMGQYTPASESGAQALYFNADPVLDAQGARQDYRDAMQSLRSLAAGARAILVLAADDISGAGRVGMESARFLEALDGRYSLEDVFETAPILSQKSGGTKGLRVFSLRNVAPADRAAQQERIRHWSSAGLPVLASWDEVKAHVDETILRIDLKEAESQSIDLERAAANESYQRPYLAFSKVGEARTMSPANIQSAAQTYLTRLEAVYGPVDEFVQDQLGMGIKTLTANFSPEQVDGVAVMISRYLVGRSSLLADDTGIGKGRQLAAVATWANKRGHDVVFVTDRANLFSDLARDLKHIGEWDRFRPLVLNADGEITHEETLGSEPVVLAKSTTPAEMQAIIARNLSLGDLQKNIAFLSYSQISSVDSEKALWLKNQLGNALVIFDEAHVAAGSDSNIAVHVAEIASTAKHVQFASATWAKTHDNMHIYQRAFPQSVAVGTLAETMRKGGDSFSEIFSTMLAAEGALIRREHDLSKLEVEMVIDTQQRGRNEDISDRVADVLGSASFISGDMQQVFIRANAESVAKLRGARDVRAASQRAKLFSSSFGAGSVIYQVMKSVQGALNATHVADLAVESAAKGMKPVIVSDATGESLVEAMIEDQIRESRESGRPDIIRMPTLRDMLRHVIYRRLATVRVEEVTALDVAEDDEEVRHELRTAGGETDLAEDAALTQAEVTGAPAEEAAPGLDPLAEDGVDVQAAFAAVVGASESVAEDAGAIGSNRTTARRKRVFRDVPIADLEDMPQQAKERYAVGLQELEDKIMAVPDMPVIAFDVMVQRLRDAGITIGEISGRKNSLVRLDDMEGMWRIVPRARSKKAVKATIRAFNNGYTQACLINRSAAAGVSMHASPRFMDQARRHLIEHQIPEDPVTRVQLLGRVNRYDQLSSPLITTASTGIFGEVRYLMMQNRKLARMSANVRSSRDNAMSLKGVTDLFNVVGRRAVQGFLQDNPLITKRLGIGDGEIEQNPDIVNKLTMRIPLLRVQQQEVVYNELYSRVDEIMLRAELDGENPLRPNEMDIRAKTASEMVFFGDDSPADEFTSAFDAPVIAKRLTWSSDTNPLSYNAVLEAAKVNVERLRESGYLLPAVEGAKQPEISPELLAKVVQGYHGLTRLAHMSTDAATYEEAMTKYAAAKRSYAKYTWIKENLKSLMPGAKIVTISGERTDLDGETRAMYTTTVITDVRPPLKEDDLLDPGKWKLTVVTSGDERPQTYTLRSVLSAMQGYVRMGEVTNELLCDYTGPSMTSGLFTGSQALLRNQFELVFRGRKDWKATALTGNMYLAAEWAAATRKGQPAIYTDDAGQRHRVIMLADDVRSIDPQYLPVRVADPVMIQRFLQPLAVIDQGVPLHGDGVIETQILDTTFKSALAAIDARSSTASTAKRDAIMAIAPGQVLALSCSPKDARRIKAALTSGQNGMRKSAMGPAAKTSDDPSHVIVRSHIAKKQLEQLPASVLGAMRTVVGISGSRDIFGPAAAIDGPRKTTNAAVISLTIGTPAQVHRAIELVCRFSGLEVYASTDVLKSRARDVIRSVLSERRLAMRDLQQQLMRERQAATEPTSTRPATLVPENELPETESFDQSPESVS